MQNFLKKPRIVRNLGRDFSFTVFTYLQQSGDAILLWYQDVVPLLGITQRIRKIEVALFELK